MMRLNSFCRGFPSFSLMLIAFSVTSGYAQDRAAWMHEARWGVMTHYLAEYDVPNRGGPR